MCLVLFAIKVFSKVDETLVSIENVHSPKKNAFHAATLYPSAVFISPVTVVKKVVDGT